MNSSNSIKRITSIVISIALRVIVYSFLIVAVLVTIYRNRSVKKVRKGRSE